MANKPQDEQKSEQKSEQDLSRRKLLFGAGAGAVGILAGGTVGFALPRRKAPSPPTAEIWLGRNIADCTGCRLCEVACSEIKEQKIQPGIARIAVHQFYPGIEFPVACHQCGDDSKCVEACPTRALTVDPSKKVNAIKVDESLCLRTAKNGDCTLCLDKCPGLVVNFHPTTRAPLFCDLCDGDPACVKVCPSGTITLNGVKMAAIQPKQIAAGLSVAYRPAHKPGEPIAPPALMVPKA
jgi:Fe-S-cluster-containing hydrogenase component 2